MIANDVIGMAWEDRISFEEIEKKCEIWANSTVCQCKNTLKKILELIIL